VTDPTPPPVSTRRLLALLAAVALARSLALASAAAGGPARTAGFVSAWTGLFGVVLLPLTLLEAPLLRGVAGHRVRAAAVLLVTGAVWSALGARLVPTHFGTLGIAGLLAAALGGAAAALAIGLPGRGSRRWALAGLALAVAAAAGLRLLDPSARYGARYAENRLGARDLGRPAPVPGDPARFSDLEVATAIARTWMATHPPEALRWSWEEAVALEGLLAYGRAAGDPEPARYAAAWVRSHVDGARREALWADAAAPAATILALDPAARPPGAEAVLARVTAYLRGGAKRTREGAYSHTGDLAGGLLPPSAWVDSLFMHGVFLNRLYAEGAPDTAWAGEAALTMARAMARRLRDPATGLFRHAWLELGPVGFALPVESCFWARGNGWVAYFVVDHQRARHARGLQPHPELNEILRAMLDSLRGALDPATGLWRSDLLGAAAADNAPETSASALFLAAWTEARRMRLVPSDELDAELLERVRTGLRARIRWVGGHPILEGTSTGTSPGFRAAYRAVPHDVNVGHGVGAVLLALGARASD
jgi:rhamnogalacturonyl hydrolase YesR